jgi:nucleoid-associated protein YgaU
MPGLFEQLGSIFRRPGSASPAAVQAPPAAEAAPAPAPAAPEAAAPVQAAPEAPPASASAPPASAPAPAATPEAPAETAPPAAAPAPQAEAHGQVAPAAPAPAPAAAAPAAAPAEPAKSPEEVETEQLWGQIDQAWAVNDFQQVTILLDRLRSVDPQEDALIDEKLAAAQFNYGGQVERGGDLQKALYLYQEAKRRNPNLGEADFAIERVQALLAAPPAAAPAAPPAADQAEQRTYTVQGGDTLAGIAQQMYGDGNAWQQIFDANRDQLSDPNMIQPGQVLKIPQPPAG